MTRQLDSLIRRTGVLCRYGVLASGVLFLLVSAAVAVEVVLRKTLDVSIGGIDEMSGFVLAISCSWGFAFALLHRAHIRIDTVQLVLPKKACAMLDVVGLVLLTGFMGIVGWRATVVLMRSVELGANALMLDFPIWIPQAIWVAGFLVFTVLALLLLVRSLIALAGGDLATAHRLIGSRSAYEEVELEAGQVARYREAEE